MLKKAIFKYKKNSEDSFFNLQGAQNELFSILVDFQKFCEDYDIQFSLTYGSLLGAAREKDIIKWDDDIDLMMTSDNVSKLMSFRDKLSDYNLCSYHYSSTKNIYTNEVRIYRKGIYRLLEDNGKKFLTPLCVDIFPFEKIDNYNADESLKYEKILNKITKLKKILILKESKYNSKTKLRYFLRQIKKMMYAFKTSRSLHKLIDIEISKLYTGDDDYSYFSPFANESFKVTFKKEFFDKIIKLEFRDMMAYSIADYDTFLTKVYNKWRVPVDRYGGSSNDFVFVKRESEIQK